MEKERILINAIRCKKCDILLVSFHGHDFKTCKCGAVSIDGGEEYLKRTGNDSDYIDLSQWDKDNEDDEIEEAIKQLLKINLKRREDEIEEAIKQLLKINLKRREDEIEEAIKQLLKINLKRREDEESRESKEKE